MSRLEHLWYERSPWALVLLPLAGLFCLLVWLRRLAYRTGVLPSFAVSVPVIIVGNITVGGTGKTPLVAWLAAYLRSRGLRPGIISRGYGGRARSWPQQVRPDSDPVMVGDEAVLLARRSGCPMAVGPDRVAAARSLIEHHDCDIIISDDGLQHYALKRDVEIAVIDGVRRFGTGFCLPAGPLREPVSRLASVDLVVVNGLGGRLEYPMSLTMETPANLRDASERPLPEWRGRTVHAVAGIGNPERFFTALEQQGLKVVRHAFADHYAYQPGDLDFEPRYPVMMTEKDAVKCARFDKEDCWVVPVAVVPSANLESRIEKLIADVTDAG